MKTSLKFKLSSRSLISYCIWLSLNVTFKDCRKPQARFSSYRVNYELYYACGLQLPKYQQWPNLRTCKRTKLYTLRINWISGSLQGVQAKQSITFQSTFLQNTWSFSNVVTLSFNPWFRCTKLSKNHGYSIEICACEWWKQAVYSACRKRNKTNCPKVVSCRGNTFESWTYLLCPIKEHSQWTPR